MFGYLPKKSPVSVYSEKRSVLSLDFESHKFSL